MVSVAVQKVQRDSSKTAASSDRENANALLAAGPHPYIGQSGREEKRDQAGRVVSVTTWDGTGTVWEHDAAGRLVSTTQL